MPGIHQRQIAIHQTRFATPERHDVQLAVRAHQQPVVVLNEHDPAAVWGHLGKVVAHSIPGSPNDRHRFAASALVKGNAVQVVLDLRFPGIIGIFGLLSAFWIGIASNSPAKDQILPVRRPKRAGLYEPRIVRTRKRPQLLFLPVVPGEDAPSRVKNLVEAQVVIVRAEKAIREPWRKAGVFVLVCVTQGGRPDRGHNVPAVRRNL